MKTTIKFNARTLEAEHFIKEMSQYPGLAVTTIDEDGFCVNLFSFNNVGAEVIRRAERKFNH